MSIKPLIYRIARKYGISKMAEEMGVNESTFKNKVNMHSETHHVYAEELEYVAEIANTDEIANYFAGQRGLMCIKKTNFDDFSDKAILDLFLDLQKEQGEWSQKISDSLSDGEITWDELTEIRKEYNEFIVAAAEVMNRLEAYMAVSEEAKSKRSVNVND